MTKARSSRDTGPGEGLAQGPEGASADKAREEPIARLLQNSHGEGAALDPELLPRVYDQLRRLATRLLERESRQTIQATELVHEAWMRMLPPEEVKGADYDEVRRRFLSLASQAMRWVIVDRARQRKAAKRGGDWQRITFCEGLVTPGSDTSDILDIDAALTKLEDFKPRLARIAELRLFGGLSTHEAGVALGISRSLATDEWALARSLLAQSLAAR